MNVYNDITISSGVLNILNEKNIKLMIFDKFGNRMCSFVPETYFKLSIDRIEDIYVLILIYDINKKRVGKAVKICRKYLIHIQKSVFEGNIIESKLKKLKFELRKLIHTVEDAICIYTFESSRYAQKEQIGTCSTESNII